MRLSVSFLLSILAPAAFLAEPAFAGCNIIPPAVRMFRGEMGAVDRPFARPGDWLTITSSGDCAAGAAALPSTAETVVTLIFTPPGNAPRRVVAFAERCATLDTGGCPTDVACIAANSSNDPVSLERLDERTVRFRFPDTDALFQAVDDDRTLAGPVTIAVTSADEPVPCALATASCTQHEGTRACIDSLYANNGTCNRDPDSTFVHFTALPPPNNYAALCTEPAFPAGPCTGTADEIRFTIDTAGNVLLPMDWRGVRVDRDAVPVARLLRASSSVEAFPGEGVAVNVTDVRSLGSYSPEGIKLPPLFDPQQNPEDHDATTFFGSTDAAETVLRLARGAACMGGSAAGLSCVNDDGCPGGTCDRGLFDFESRLLDGVGPAVLRLGACFGGTSPLATCVDDASCAGGQCGDFELVALDPVPLDGLNQSELLNAFVLEEAIPNPPQDFNGDGDADDHVIKLGDRGSGLTQAIGINGSEGRAIARVLQAPFSFPALAAEGDLVAFLEPEPLQAGIDTNGNGLIFDSTLRVYRIGPTSAVDLSPSPPVAAEADPVIDGRSVVTSAGRVFFRRAERDGAPSVVTEELYLTPPGTTIDGFFAYTTFATVSDDARYVVFSSDSAQLVSNDTNNVCDYDVDGVADENCLDVFVIDRLDRSTTRVSVASDGSEGNAGSFLGPISRSGRFISFGSRATNLDPVHPGAHQFIHDRASRSTTGVPLDGIQSISDDGQLLLSLECEPTGPDSQRCDEWLLDRRSGALTRIGHVLGPMPTATVDFPLAGALTPDGSAVTFWSNFDDPVQGTGEGRGGIFVHDRIAGTTTRVSVSIDGVPANGLAYFSALSRDGRFVAFDSPATNLVTGDTNGVFDLFVHDRLTGFTGRVNITSTGQQAGERSLYPLASNARFGIDGRRVYFLSPASNLAPPDPNGSFYFVHDRLTAQTANVPFLRPDLPGPLYASTSFIGISADERVRTFQLCAPISGQPNCRPGFRFEEIDPALADLTGDGDVDDTVLAVLDAGSGSVTAVCPATAVSIANGAAAFLRPEAAGVTTVLASCPLGDDGAADLNGDGDASDHIVHTWAGAGPARNLQRAATAVSLSDRTLAALVSEGDQGSMDLNGDDDASDTVVQVFADDQWTNLGQAADAVQANGPVVAFTTAEAAQGGTDLNDDGDTLDRVVQVLDLDDPRLSNVGQAAEDFVAGASGLVAFRTREARQGNQALNGDGDGDDDVLQVYDPVTGRVLNTGLAVTPCMLEACDPRAPYRVLNDTVKFLTYESAQGADLNGDGDRNDLVVQVVNVRQACHTGSMAGACHTLAAVTAGICTTTAQACATDANCGGGTCFVPPGGCIRDLGTSCTLRDPQPCGADAFCQPAFGTPGVGTCHTVAEPCRDNADCSAPATCSDGGKTFNRLLDPLKQQNGGAAVFTGAGRCVEDFGTPCQHGTTCGAGAFCEVGTCRREHGVCARDADCPSGSACRQDLIRATAEDRDGDELPDAFDNCPEQPNIMQEDRDGDGVGDACGAAANGASDDDGCMLVAPRRLSALGALIWLLPMLLALRRVRA